MNGVKEVMSVKAKINNYAKSNNITAQTVLQNLMFERFLERLSKSEYQDKFIVKGGVLISNMVGLDTRSTMDLDVTLRNLPLEEEIILQVIKQISQINLDDDITFSGFQLFPIRPDDEYGGFRIKFNTTYFSIVTPLSIDLTTGDKITPQPMEYEFSPLFGTERPFKLWGYNIETILAEKLQTIIGRGIASTRPRDFYDVYILTKEKLFDKEILKSAFTETCTFRGTENLIQEIDYRMVEIEQSKALHTLWSKYAKQFSYAKDIPYEDLMKSLKNLLNTLVAK